MKHQGWISRELLTFLDHTPVRLLFSSDADFRVNGPRLIDAWAFALWALLLIAMAVGVWKLRSRLVKPVHECRLWLVLVLTVFGGSALWYSLISEPDTDVNFWPLAPTVAKLPGPVYTDRYTSFVLEYLSSYKSRKVRSAGYLPDTEVLRLLQARRGCLLLSEPQLRRETASHLAPGRTSIVFTALRRPPSGWRVVKRVTATDNPFESIVILCADSTSG